MIGDIILIMLFMASFILQAASESPKLVLVRNGESEWKKLNLFVGWSDDSLSEQGRKEVIQGGKLLKEGGYNFDILKRALQTTFHLLDEIDQLHIPIMKGLNLNDRHYGALQGLKKKEIEKKYGSEQVNSWRKSFDIPPPALDEKDERNPANQAKYKKYPKNILPYTNLLKILMKESFHILAK
jgi:2,3-bisphosphoglycerate-dependent phosphoglycerate mutase